MNDKINDAAKAITKTMATGLITLNTLFTSAMKQIAEGIPIKNIIASEAIPGISFIAGGIYNYKSIRAQRNISKFKEELSKMEDMEIKNEREIEYIKNMLIPIVLDNVENETQTEKIKLIVNGVESTVADKNLMFEDITFIYYDILKELRILDIKLLLKIYKNGNGNKISKDGKFIETDEEAFDKYIVNKLKDKTLITVPTLVGELAGEGLSAININDIKITKLGINLIKFFRVNNEETME